MTRSRVAFGSFATLVVLGSGCLSDPETPAPIVFEGVVTSDGPSLPTGTEVLAVSPVQQIVATAPVDGSGAYRIEVSALVGCSARMVAFVRESPFLRESDAGFVPQPNGPCEGVLPGPALTLPMAVSELDTARVVGTVTAGGQPAAATVFLFIDSFVDGPIVVAEVATDASGEYEVEGAVPSYYCNNLEVATDPPATDRWPVSGCSASLIDIVIG